MAMVGPSPYAPDPKPLPPRSPVRGYQVTNKNIRDLASPMSSFNPARAFRGPKAAAGARRPPKQTKLGPGGSLNKQTRS